jgi:ketosteroid isomerase-like protein
MSQENVEIVMKGFEAFARGDLGTMKNALDPEVEIVTEPDMPDQEVLRGHEGFASYLEDIAERWDDFRIDIDEIVDAGDEVVVIGSQCGVGKRSGIELDEWPFAGVYEIEGGTVTRVRLFHSRAEALDAAGLSE